MQSPDDLVERVVVERRLRGLSQRDAAAAGGISNTTWAKWEASGGPPSERQRRAVAQALGWPTTWVESPPDVSVSPAIADDVLRRLERLERGLMILAIDLRTMLTTDRQVLLDELIDGIDDEQPLAG